MIWHSSTKEEVKRELGVSEEQGLSAAEVVSRIQQYGENKQTGGEKQGMTRRILGRVSNLLTILLTVVSLIMLVTGLITHSATWYVPLFILAVLAIHIAADLWIEKRAGQELDSLKGDVSLRAKVRRDGETAVVDSAMLVPGDIVLLEAGDYIPADGRLLWAYSLLCEESAVTGDAAPVEKQADYLPEDICPLEDRKNMVYAGCSVTYGQGVMVVTETGADTELGRQTALLRQTGGGELPIRKKLSELGRIVSYGVLAVCALIFLIGLICGPAAGERFSDLVFGMLLTAAALAIAALPETLPKAVTCAFGFGVRRLLERKIVVKNLGAIERLGEVTVILSDKTGTLTKNRMHMAMLYDGVQTYDLDYDTLNENGQTLIRTGALCCNGSISMTAGGKQKAVGDPTEAGIVAACMQFCGLGKEDIENIYPRMAEVPFDSERKLMTTVNMINNRPFAIVKGAPDMLMTHCVAGNLAGAEAAAQEMAGRGMRVIAVALKPLAEVPSNPTPESMECGLTLLGLFGMRDTISLGTRNALKESVAAGIRTVMVTGDHITTATAVAKSLGLLGEGQKAITGEELAGMTEAELKEQLEQITVYARISAEDKLRVIAAWKERGETVAVTGDSVADARALKAADIGCAMGVTGTDISKGSADIVLTEDSYISIVGAVQESKGIYANIKRIVAFLLSSNLGELLVMLLGLLIFGISPLTALPLLWLNLITDFAPALALGAEPVGKNGKLKKPMAERERFFAGEYGISILWQGALIGLLGLIAYAIGNTAGAGVGAAMAFAVLGLSQPILAFSLRSEGSLITEGLHTNRFMLYALLAAAFPVILILSTPLRAAFGLGVISGGMVWHILWLSLMPFLVTEGVKWAKVFLKK